MEYETHVYDPALAGRVERAAIHAARSGEGQTILRAMAPVSHCSVEMRQFYWLTFLHAFREETQRVPGDQEMPALPGQEDDDL